jgi:hypothetical protein
MRTFIVTLRTADGAPITNRHVLATLTDAFGDLLALHPRTGVVVGRCEGASEDDARGRIDAKLAALPHPAPGLVIVSLRG